MSRVDCHVNIRASAERIFDCIHDYDRRLEWDPFLSGARLLDGAQAAGPGVRTRCTARWYNGWSSMVTRYIQYKRPTVAAIVMEQGPWIFNRFAASICIHPAKEGATEVTYAFVLQARWRWLTPWLRNRMHRDTQFRLQALKVTLENPGKMGHGSYP